MQAGVVSICTRARPRLTTSRVATRPPSPADNWTCSCHGRARRSALEVPALRWFLLRTPLFLGYSRRFDSRLFIT
jgi:hypothetical protein